jgi:hypothetical protein
MPAPPRRTVPTIVCVNEATVSLGVSFDRLVRALRRYANELVAPVWGTHAKLVSGRKIPPHAWALVFLDDSDAAGDLGYHELTPHGCPLSRVFVRTTLDAGEVVSATASHELAEMLVDPGMSLYCDGPREVYEYEVGDPVEEESFRVDGVPMSDFVFPTWFETFHAPDSTRFDYLGHAHRPFEILKGGYMTVRRHHHSDWTTVYGSVAKSKRSAKKDRRGHRTELRAMRRAGEPLRHSHLR